MRFRRAIFGLIAHFYGDCEQNGKDHRYGCYGLLDKIYVDLSYFVRFKTLLLWRRLFLLSFASDLVFFYCYLNLRLCSCLCSCLCICFISSHAVVAAIACLSPSYEKSWLVYSSTGCGQWQWSRAIVVDECSALSGLCASRLHLFSCAAGRVYFFLVYRIKFALLCYMLWSLGRVMSSDMVKFFTRIILWNVYRIYRTSIG